MSEATAAPPGAETVTDTAPTEPNAEEGKLFEVPRVKVAIDTTDPTVLKLAFAGGIEIERGEKAWVDFYNSLKPGQSRDLTVTVFCSGPKQVHRRDSEGDVDAVVQTKSLVVTDVHTEAA